MIHARTIQRQPGKHTASAAAIAAVCGAVAANARASRQRVEHNQRLTYVFSLPNERRAVGRLVWRA